ncbi:type II secretion system F family protein [Anaerolentibacter hominis]|uniref:type II secretion system F family protein n=1 Tax=Anaerolentibacter hominis TaxID=3079009 RepID=UPI0031B88F29
MTKFTYQVMTPDGKKKRGTVEAANRDSAMRVLRSEGNIIVSVKEAGVLQKDISLSFLKRKVKVRDMCVFCRQFVTLMTAGVNVVRALQMLEEQTEGKLLRRTIHEIRVDVEKGFTLAASMEKHEDVFTTLFVSMVAAGEASGNLEGAFEQMANQYEKSAKLRATVVKAMIYPIIVLVVTIVIVIVLTSWIVPKFVDLLGEMDTDMPGYTMFIVGFSKWMAKYWIFVVLGLAALFVAVRVYFQTETGRRIKARMAMRMPIFGKLTVKNACAQFSRSFSSLIASGVGLIEALEIVARSMTNAMYEDVIRHTATQVSKGTPMAEPLSKSKIFPPMVCNMVSIGEETGAIVQMLKTVAEYYEEEVEQTTAQVAATIEPLMILLMAGIVIGVLAAVFLPMLSMYQNLSGVV